MFELLFKYRPALFGQGELGLAASPVVVAVVVAGALLAVPVLLRYRRVRGSRLDRWSLAGIRLAVLAIVAGCLLQPVLVLSSVVPHESVVGLVFDNSLSMRVQDAGAAGTRAALLQALFAEGEGGGALRGLEQRFKVRSFGFDRDARRLSSVGELTFDGSQSRPGRALTEVADELAGVPISGLLLFTDGAASTSDPLTDALLDLGARGIPVYPVALGRERFERDIEISRVDAPRTVLLGSTLQVDVTLSQTGFSGQTVALEVEDDGRLVARQEVRFPADGEAVVATASFAASAAGPRRFRFQVALQAGEMVAENNRRETLIEAVDRRDKILYFEGEPRHEVGFLRRAVGQDSGLQVVSLIRLAENHTYRLEVDGEEELIDGFPKRREELFKYRGLVLGSIEASYFSYDQLRMISDFVSERGGGLLLLGGRSAFAEGGYAETPLADALPVVLTPHRSDDPPFFAEIAVQPTAYGRHHPAVQLAGDPEGSAALWAELPRLSTFNRLTQLKPGAVALLEGHGEELGENQVVLAHQRFGRGRTLALTVHDTWKWQMQMPLEDQSQETLWRQLMRWLVSYVPDPVELAADAERAQIGEPVTLTATVRDDSFLGVNNARVLARVTAPSGSVEELAMEWAVAEDGAFRAAFTPLERGLYEVVANASSQGVELGTSQIHLEATDLEDELFGAQLRPSVLERIASETGGRVYQPDELNNLVEDLTYSGEGSTVKEARELWDMPAVFLLLLGLLATEWGLRRRRGLA